MSMLSQEQYGYIDRRLRQINNCDLPFGNMSIIFSGDFAQLPPIGNQKIVYVNYDAESAIEKVGKYLYKNIQSAFILEKIERQENDKIFTDLLDRCRYGIAEKMDYDTLKERFPNQNKTDQKFINAPECHYYNEEVRIAN